MYDSTRSSVTESSDLDDIDSLNTIGNLNSNLKNIIDVSDFNRDNLRSLFKNASILKQNVKKYGKLNILSGKTIGLYFDEPSSRTYGSFYVAVKKLGGDVLSLNSGNSSTQKGESLYDTLKCIEAYCDLVVIRTSQKKIHYQNYKIELKFLLLMLVMVMDNILLNLY